MHITEPHGSQWGPRPESAPLAGRAREQRSATIASQLDQSPRDGWIDEDDLPYDQLELLERARATAAKEAARQEPSVDVRVADGTPPPPVEAPAPRVDVSVPDAGATAPRIDLLA
jgi:hypothetical protein